MLKDCIAAYFAKTAQMDELFDAEQPELDQAQEEILGWMEELHILTSTDKSIELWEDDYYLDHNTDITLQQRRARIFAKKSRRLLPRLETLRQTMATLLNNDKVQIYERDCNFEIYVETPELIDTFSIVEEFFRETRPAHWSYTFINTINREYQLKAYIGVAVFTYKSFTMEMVE